MLEGSVAGPTEQSHPSRPADGLATSAQVPLESRLMKTIFAAGRPAFALLVLVLGLSIAVIANPRDATPPSDEPAETETVTETVQTLDGRQRAGRFLGDSTEGFRFEPEDGSKAISSEEIARVNFGRLPIGPRPDETPPPFVVDLGLGRRLSGQLEEVSADAIRLRDGPGGQTVTLGRGGVLAIRQRPGELQVLRERFDRLDRQRWRTMGRPELAEEPRLEGDHSLRLPAGSTSLTHRLPTPIGSGRLDLAYFQEAARTEGQKWFVDLLFDGPFGNEVLQVILGWEEESPGVIFRGGPGLVIQPLSPGPGWHRLGVQFGPGRTLLAIDGDELAHGKGTNGPLVEIRLASEATRSDRPPDDLAAYIDDLHVIRFAEPSGGLEIDTTQDEVRLHQGDQLFGNLRSSDADRLVLEFQNRPISLSWTEVSGVHFRREPRISRAVEGWLVRVHWQAGPGNELDRIDGALLEIDADRLLLDTPYAGRLAIPRNRLQRLEGLGQGRRIVLDPFSHHLGDQVMPELDPPYHEADFCELDFELAEVPEGQAVLVLDVVEVEGEAEGLRFAREVRRGELRTKVSINGQEFDYLNRHITTQNKAPQRIRLEVPEGLLQSGSNRLRFDQTGTENQPSNRDDLGLLGIALEFPSS
ncbi:hypothetical protein BH23PLA1_BH23PLA1_01380 [soil metagenome]